MTRFLLLLSFCAFLACQNQKDTNQVFFQKPPKEALDSVCTWLYQGENYLNDNYLPLFEKHFNQQLTVNNIDSAARLLDMAGNACEFNYKFDTVLLQKHLDFLSKYEYQIKPRFRTGLYNNIGEMFVNNEEFEKSNTYFRKNNLLPKDCYTELNIACSLQGLMYNFGAMGQHDSCIVYGQKAMTYFEKNQDKIGQCQVNSELSTAYRYMNIFSESEKYTKKCLQIAKEIGDSTLIFIAMNNLVIVHNEMGSNALPSSIDTLVNFEKNWKTNIPDYKLTAQAWWAEKYFIDSNYVETAKILKQIAPLFPLCEQHFYTEAYINILSKYEINMHKPLTLKKLYLEELKEAKKKKLYSYITNYSGILSEDAKRKNDYKTAYQYLIEKNNANDSLLNTKIRYEATELEKKYQTEKKEAQLKQQADDAFKKNVFIGFLVLALLAFVYFYSLLKKQKNIIAQQNELNEHTIAILSHDIKEPLLGVKLLLKKLNKDDPFVAQASQSLENQINSVNGILNNLLKMKKLSLGKKDKNIKANVKSVVQNVSQELSIAIQSKGLTIQNDLEDDLMLPIAPEKLQIIVHNLLSNAVKYSFPNQTVRIFKDGKGLCIQDFGVGLSEEQRTKLMREVTASEKGTNAERGNGLGLFLVGAMLQGEAVKVIFDSPAVGGTIAKVLG